MRISSQSRLGILSLRPRLSFSLLAACWYCGDGRAEVLVNVDATQLPEGPVSFVPNSGTAGGGFQAVGGGTNDPVISRPAVLGPVAIELDGTDFLAHVESEDGPFQIADGSLTGPDPQRSIEVWVFNPEVAQEETMVAWGRRGGGDGTNMSFNYGTHAAYGAVGHWGSPDIGWLPDGDGCPEPGVWQYLVYTFDGDTTRVYAGGQLSNWEELGGGVIDTWADTPIVIGSQMDNATPAFTAALRGSLSIARVRVHNTVLSDAEIAAKYNEEAVTFNRRPLTLQDADGDGMDDRWEQRFLGGTGATAGADPDGDGLTNLAEFQAGTDPSVADTDGDGLTDGQEVNRMVNGNPAPTNPLSPDTDGDGLPDGVETGTGIFVSPTDTGSNPLLVDTDGDSVPDGIEVSRSSNPNDPNQIPDPLQLISLDALSLNPGPLPVWTNTGTVSGDFAATHDVPSVTFTAGRKAVTLDGVSDWYVGPVAPQEITGNASRTVEAWVYNPEIAGEETIFSWGRRGGPDGTNCSFNFGDNAAFGAVGHWGAPDIGWEGAVEPAKWTFLTYSYDGLTFTTRVYVDGIEVNSEELTGPLSTHSLDTVGNPLRFVVGAQTNDNGTRETTLAGSLSIARISVYDQALPPDVIARHYNELATVFGRTPTVFTDTDGDSIDDNAERFYFGDLSRDGNGDPDGDSLTTAAELQAGTNPAVADTDGDGAPDGAELSRTVNGAAAPTDPLNPDTDGDGIPDGAETGTGVFVSASDTGSDPLRPDTDGDGFPDGLEVALGSDPVSAASTPDPVYPPLVHRYDFSSSTGGIVPDLAGNAHGEIKGEGFSQAGGALQLFGGTSDFAAYVDLPNGIISALGAAKGGTGKATFEGWMTVEAADTPWARFFDFGSNSPGGDLGELPDPGDTNGGGTNGLDYICLAAYRDTNGETRRVEWADNDPVGQPVIQIDFNHDTFGSEVHFVMTIDEEAGQLAYYENGTLIGTRSTTFLLSDLNDVNNWLGRSNYTNDGNLQGQLNEFRIYAGVLSPALVQLNYSRGPDVPPGQAVVVPGFRISSVAFDPGSRAATLTWASEAGRTYAVQQSSDLQTWTQAGTVPGAAGTTTFTTPPVPEGASRLYFRVVAQ